MVAQAAGLTVDDRLRWFTVALALILGAGLVVLGLLDGNAWATLAGGLLTGGGAVGAAKRTP